jgi:hypothetical protein
VNLLEHQDTQGQQHHDGHDQDEPQAPADRHIAQAVHNVVLRFFVLVMNDRQHLARPDNAKALIGLV